MVMGIRRTDCRAAAIIVIVALLIVASVSACANQPRQHIGGSITYVEAQEFDSLYPPAADFYPNGGIVHNITDRLLFQDPVTLDLYPWIATALPEVNENATEFTFKLRKDVTYSDGSHVNAANVVRNFDLFGLGDEGRRFAPSPALPHYQRAEALDAYTVKFYFSEPTPEFPQAVSMPRAGLLADATLKRTMEGFGPGHATDIVASGPFVVSDERVGEERTLTARDDYNWAPAVREHEGRPAIDSVRVVFNQEDTERVGLVTGRAADIAARIDPSDESQVRQARLNLVAASTRGVNNSLTFRPGHPLLQDKRVRQAIIAGVDRKAIRDDLFTDSYPLATSILAEQAPGYKKQKPYKHDTARANTLLDQAGWVRNPDDGIREKNGQRLSLNVNDALPLPRSKEVVAMLQEQLKDIGVEINFYPGDFADQVEAVKDPNKIQLFHSMSDGTLYQQFSTSRIDAAHNTHSDGSLLDPQLEELLAPQTVEQAQDYLTEQAYVLPLVEQPVVYGLRTHVHGFDTDPTGLPSFYQVSRLGR